jgi:ribose-phosphate pyrophosphokinase
MEQNGVTNLGLALMHKERLKTNDEEYITVIGDVKDKTCIIVDDICDTAETLMIVA